MTHLSRREFLGGVAGAAALGHSAWSRGHAYAQTPLPPPEQSGIDHVICLTRGFERFQVVAAVETPATSYVVAAAPPGRYFIRLTAKDQFGNVISTSNEIEVIVH